jgi:hypothetical protein
MRYYRSMRFLVPVLLLVAGALTSPQERTKVPGVPVTVMASEKFTEDDEYRYEVSRRSASIKSARSYMSELEGTLSMVATVTEYGKMKLTKEKLRFSFASTVWDYETDTEDKQEILEEKETAFGPIPAYFVKMKVKPADDSESYLFEGYMFFVDSKEVFLTAVYFDTPEGNDAVKNWTKLIEVDGHTRGEMKEIKEDE